MAFRAEFFCPKCFYRDAGLVETALQQVVEP